MRVQALRQKGEAIGGAANEDAWTQHVTERSMLLVADPDAGRLEAARAGAAPAACVGQSIEQNVSEDGIDSHDAAFETWVSKQPWNRRAKGSGETSLHEVACEAMAEPPLTKSRLAGRDLPATGRDSPGRAY